MSTQAGTPTKTHTCHPLASPKNHLSSPLTWLSFPHPPSHLVVGSPPSLSPGCRFPTPPLTWLSLPPDASSLSSGDHLRPHTSDLCPESRATKSAGLRTSRCSTERSRLPVESRCAAHESVPQRMRWPAITRTHRLRTTSHTCGRARTRTTGGRDGGGVEDMRRR